MAKLLGFVSRNAGMEMDDRASRGSLSTDDAELHKDDNGYYLSNIHWEGDGMDGDIDRLDLDEDIGRKLHLLAMVDDAKKEGELAEALASDDEEVVELALRKQEEFQEEV